MTDFQPQFEAFMKQLQLNAASLPFSFSEYPIDHACYRVATPEDYQNTLAAFEALSSVVVSAPHHERNFHILLLKNPLTHNDLSVSCIELSEPGGSDSYRTGFQHIEFHATKDLQQLVAGNTDLAPYFFIGKFGDEHYLKWPDKLALKFTATPVLIKSLSKEDAKIVQR